MCIITKRTVWIITIIRIIFGLCAKCIKRQQNVFLPYSQGQKQGPFLVRTDTNLTGLFQTSVFSKLWYCSYKISSQKTFALPHKHNTAFRFQPAFLLHRNFVQRRNVYLLRIRISLTQSLRIIFLCTLEMGAVSFMPHIPIYLDPFKHFLYVLQFWSVKHRPCLKAFTSQSII